MRRLHDGILREIVGWFDRLHTGMLHMYVQTRMGAARSVTPGMLQGVPPGGTRNSREAGVGYPVGTQSTKSIDSSLRTMQRASGSLMGYSCTRGTASRIQYRIEHLVALLESDISGYGMHC